MATVRLKENPVLNDQMLRTEKLVFAAKIGHNATAANKTFSSDVPSVAYVRAEGQTATVDALETLTWTSPADNSSGCVFGLYLNIGKTVTPSLGPVATAEDYADAVYTVTVKKGATGSALTVTGPNASSSFLTPLGNIAIEVTDSSGNLTTTDEPLVVEVSYREQIK